MSLTQLQEVPSKSLILLVGAPGSGKSNFCQETVLRNLAMEKPVIYVTTECGSSEAEGALKEGGLGKVEPGLLNFIDAYNDSVGVSVSDRPDTVRADCNDLSSIDIAISKLNEKIGRKGILLVFDSLTSPYLFSGSEILRFMRQTLSRFTALGNAVIAGIDEGCGRSEDLVAMMSLSSGVIKMETEDGKTVLDVVKHPKVESTRIRLPRARAPEKMYDVKAWEELLKIILRMMGGKAGAPLRKEMGDYVNLFWTNFAHWSGMLWDPKRFPEMTYELGKGHGAGMKEMMEVAPWHQRLLFKSMMPKSFSKVKDMKKMSKMFQMAKQARTGIFEYLEDDSETDEHYFRVHESFECCGLENVGAAMASITPPTFAGLCEGLESWRGVERDWNAVETKCVGLGDPCCEFKLVPGEIDELRGSLVKDSSVIERIHERLMQRLMGFLLDGKSLVERPRLGSDVYASMGGRAHMIMVSERYRMAMRMGGAKAGKEVGVWLMDAGLSVDEAVKRILHLLEYCKVGRVTADDTIRIWENSESIFQTLMKKQEEPYCTFITGFLNSFFYAVKNQHVREVRCVAAGDPYCEWEFR